MTVYVSTSCLTNGNNVTDTVDSYVNAGISNIELGTIREYIDGLSFETFKNLRINLLVHNYFPPPREPFIINLASQDATILEKSRQQIKTSLDFCNNLNIPLYSFHAGFRTDPDINFGFATGKVVPYETAFNTFVESITEINEYALEKGIKIAVENNVLAEYNLVKRRNQYLLFCEADEFQRLWERVPSPNLGILLDLGHLKVTAHWLNFNRYDFIDRVEDRIFAIHVHDNNEITDAHESLKESSWCFEVIARQKLRDLPIVLESWGLTIEQIVQQVTLIERQSENT